MRAPAAAGAAHARLADRLDQHFPVRYSAWLLCARGLRAERVRLGRLRHRRLAGAGACLFCVGLGFRDTRQTRHSVLRNYPVIGHLRFLLEFIRPEIRQYFIESDHEAAPFSRQQRSLVYQRAKGDSDKRPFGTQLDVHAPGYEWINHSLAPTAAADRTTSASLIGARPCSSPTAPACSTSRR